MTISNLYNILYFAVYETVYRLQIDMK